MLSRMKHPDRDARRDGDGEHDTDGADKRTDDFCRDGLAVEIEREVLRTYGRN